MIAPGKRGRRVRGRDLGALEAALQSCRHSHALPHACAPLFSNDILFPHFKCGNSVPLLWTLSTSWVKCLCLSMQGHLVQGSSLTWCWLLASRLHPGTQLLAGQHGDLGEILGVLVAPTLDLAPIAAPRPWTTYTVLGKAPSLRLLSLPQGVV